MNRSGVKGNSRTDFIYVSAVEWINERLGEPQFLDKMPSGRKVLRKSIESNNFMMAWHSTYLKSGVKICLSPAVFHACILSPKLAWLSIWAFHVSEKTDLFQVESCSSINAIKWKQCKVDVNETETNLILLPDWKSIDYFHKRPQWGLGNLSSVRTVESWQASWRSSLEH